MKYKLETENNYGLSVDTTACFEVNGEVQCDPAIIVHLADGKQQIIWREDINEPMRIPDNAEWVDEAVIHRVINITEINGSTYFVIKGDNNDVPDPYYVSPDQITDRVVTLGDDPLIIPYIGNINLWLRGL